MILNNKRRQNNSYSTVDNSHLMLKMVTSYSIFLLVIVILSIFLYQSTIKNFKNRFEMQSNALLENSITLMDKDFKIMDVFSRQLLQNSDFWTLSSSKNSTKLAFRTSGLALRDYLADNIYPDTLLPLKDFYIYFENTEQIISPNVFSARKMFYSGIKQWKSEEYETWIDLLTDSDACEQMLIMDRYYSIPNNHYYLYIIDLDTLTYRKTDSSITFIMDERQIAELFNDIYFDEDGLLVVLNEKNEIMFSLNDEDNDLYLEPEVLTSLQFTNNSASYGKMLITRSTSLQNAWKYYLIHPKNAAYVGIGGYRFVYLALIFAALAGGAYLVFFISRKNITPIIELGAELQIVSKEKSQLQEVVDKQKPLITMSYIQQIMNGSISTEDEMNYIKQYLDLGKAPLGYNVIYMVAYNNSENAGETSMSTSYLNSEEFEGVMQKSLGDFFGNPYYCYSPADRTYALLLSCESGDSDLLIMKAQEILIKLHAHLIDTYGIWLFAGIGRTTDSLMNVWESYQQATEAASYTTKNYIFIPYEIVKKDSNAFYYPPELSTKLIHFITAGNKAQVLELFGLIHQENIEERSLPINLLSFLMQDIRTTLLKARFALPASTDKEIINALDELFQEHLSFSLCEDLAIRICELFQRGTKDTNLVTTIETYIMANYKDQSLCLNKISDEFQISESYFSHMFKEKTGTNFSVYLENIRLNEAARLIRESDVNLGVLYLEVGYNNPTTFRRAFKKVYGITPSAMRENHAGKY